MSCQHETNKTKGELCQEQHKKHPIKNFSDGNERRGKGLRRIIAIFVFLPTYLVSPQLVNKTWALSE